MKNLIAISVLCLVMGCSITKNDKTFDEALEEYGEVKEELGRAKAKNEGFSTVRDTVKQAVEVELCKQLMEKIIVEELESPTMKKVNDYLAKVKQEEIERLRNPVRQLDGNACHVTYDSASEPVLNVIRGITQFCMIYTNDIRGGFGGRVFYRNRPGEIAFTCPECGNKDLFEWVTPINNLMCCECLHRASHKDFKGGQDEQ